MTSLVKIGGTKDYKSRSAQHLTSGSCYIIVYATNPDDDFRDIEANIKYVYSDERHYNEEYHYKQGMIQEIVLYNRLKLVTVCIPPKLDDKFSFIDKYIIAMIGKEYRIHDIARPGKYEKEEVIHVPIEREDSRESDMFNCVDEYLRCHFLAE